ncbi:flagellar protein FlgN [Rahnella sp. PD12R]|uniref:flagellar export chaperone FlgN n=1 Tax=Rahnella sp. PD12R TaxID=2855688 RepID=UPI001C45153E|nr:flagellar export chaperone FlgN [Rahnella sp. PD12R]MBV6820073.1 flagellar protein FlgN [Rahnella sp. PD12R]
MNSESHNGQTDKSVLIRDLLAGIGHDHARYQQLSGLLEEQRDAMIACQADTVTAVNEALMVCYQALNQSASQRYRCLKTLRLPADARGVDFLFSRLPESLAGQTRGQWKALQQQAQACQALNERNGLLLTMQQEIMQPLVKTGQADFLYSR